jgi:hypothetical protein
MAEGYISIDEALKLIPPFKGNKSEVPAFIGNVDTAFSVINPNQKDMLYKFADTNKRGAEDGCNSSTSGRLVGTKGVFAKFLH